MRSVFFMRCSCRPWAYFRNKLPGYFLAIIGIFSYVSDPSCSSASFSMAVPHPPPSFIDGAPYGEGRATYVKGGLTERMHIA